MNKRYKEDFIQAGLLAGQVRTFGKALIQPGASYNDVIGKIQQKIIDLGACAAFPPQIALNHVAAHFLPQPDEDIIFSDEVVKLDIGVCYEGAIGDCAVSIDLSGKHQVLIEAAEAALLAAEKLIRVGLPIRAIGKIIAETAAAYGLTSVKNLCGHGLARYQIHTPPSIPNYDDRSTGVIKPGMTFAIEPFVTDGKGMIDDAGNPTIFSFITARPLKTPLARALLATIKGFKGLPFATHNLVTKEMTLSEAKLGLHELLKAGVIAGYAPLVEQSNGLVAQAENSVLVDEKGQVFITTRL